LVAHFVDLTRRKVKDKMYVRIPLQPPGRELPPLP